MVETLVGDLVVKPKQRFAIVVAEFNSFITSKLAEGAVDCLLRHGAKEPQITKILVPGAFEIPLVALELARGGKYVAVICLGCVIRGETDHYDHVAGQVSRGVGTIGPETGVPTIFGVITADTLEQALNRAGLKAGNAGWNAAMSAMAAANVLAKVRE
ncbi:MAG TPA: 6,7-dimethyl-8-ribityllumazine synthase [Phycisphaerae bacterium]|jgi:6,7-dimethyl-8-ribityllumazine synthase